MVSTPVRLTHQTQWVTHDGPAGHNGRRRTGEGAWNQDKGGKRLASAGTFPGPEYLRDSAGCLWHTCAVILFFPGTKVFPRLPNVLLVFLTLACAVMRCCRGFGNSPKATQKHLISWFQVSYGLTNTNTSTHSHLKLWVGEGCVGCKHPQQLCQAQCNVKLDILQEGSQRSTFDDGGGSGSRSQRMR